MSEPTSQDFATDRRQEHAARRRSSRSSSTSIGARGNRAFCVIDDRGRMVNGKLFRKLQTVARSYDPEPASWR